jgi:nucleotide-binding universal stress UspA family protein
LDGSALAEQALSCAVTLAQGLPADLVLFRAISIPLEFEDIMAHVPQDWETQMEQLEAEASDYLGRVAGGLRKAGVTVRTVIRPGPAAEEIVDLAERVDFQLILMVTHGYSGISRWRHGSVAERVLQSASVPVLIVRAQKGEGDTTYKPMTCQRILVPLDGSATAEQALAPAVSIAQALDAKVILFRVSIAHVSGSLTGDWYLPLEGTLETANRIAEEYLDRIARRLSEQGIKASRAVRTGGVANGILKFAEANQIDLIAMCTHGRTGLGRWTLGSVADRVLRAGSLPLLLVRAK